MEYVLNKFRKQQTNPLTMQNGIFFFNKLHVHLCMHKHYVKKRFHILFEMLNLQATKHYQALLKPYFNMLIIINNDNVCIESVTKIKAGSIFSIVIAADILRVLLGVHFFLYFLNKYGLFFSIIFS